MPEKRQTHDIQRAWSWFSNRRRWEWRPRCRGGQLERSIVDALADIEAEPIHLQVKSGRITDLDCDMVLGQDVRTPGDRQARRRMRLTGMSRL
jgi:hypothetical protein